MEEIFVIYYKYTENSAFLFGCRIRHPTLRFTVINVLAYRIIMPAFAVLAYHYIAECLMSQS